MIALFKVSVNLDGGAKFFDKGEHVLTKEESENDYIQTLIGDGLIQVLQDDVVAIEAEVIETAPEAIEAPEESENDYIQTLIGDGLIQVLQDDVVAIEAEVIETAPEAIEAPKRGRKEKDAAETVE